MKVLEYLRQLQNKYRNMDRHKDIGDPGGGRQPERKPGKTLGEDLGIFSGSVRKQLPKKLLDAENEKSQFNKNIKRQRRKKNGS